MRDGGAVTPIAAPAPVPLAVADITKNFGKLCALDAVSFALEPGGVTALLGLNGAGKTTLFQILTGLFSADKGRVAVFGHDLRRSPRAALARMGVVFQAQVLDLDLTVDQNLLFYGGLHGLRGRAAREGIEAALARFGIGDLARKTVRELSGGTRRKVEIARALVTAPDLLLLDEPSTGLDARSRATLVEDVFALGAERGTAILWATHLVGEVERAADVVVLDGGRVVANGRPGDLVARAGVRSLEAAFLAITRRDVPAGAPAA